jgi:hypothetical protein
VRRVPGFIGESAGIQSHISNVRKTSSAKCRCERRVRSAGMSRSTSQVSVYSTFVCACCQTELKVLCGMRPTWKRCHRDLMYCDQKVKFHSPATLSAAHAYVRTRGPCSFRPCSSRDQLHNPASFSSESGECLRHVRCYPTVVGGEAG